MSKKQSDKSLEQFISNYPQLSKWSTSPFIRSGPREEKSWRLEAESFSIDLYRNLLQKNVPPIHHNKLRILFAHFSPFDDEMEGLGLPLYASLAFPNSSIDFTYDKGGTDCYKYRIVKNQVNKLKELRTQYDMIIGRSGAFINMKVRKNQSLMMDLSRLKINIKTMSYSHNLRFADHYFEEEDMCPPPSPLYLDRVEDFISQHKKENIIIVSGTMWYVKNQLQMIEQIDAQLLNGYTLAFIGPLKDKSYIKKIRHVADCKNIDYHILGKVNKRLAQDIATLSKIAIIPQDQRSFGQPKGYPRVVGESIGSRCLTLCNSPITVPDFYANSCLQYSHEKGDFNMCLEKAIGILKDDNYLKTWNWSPYTMEDHCKKTLNQCWELYKGTCK
tara:strand:- start:1046 stop:2206 length:1161 start_codon:yes stop_codon:yes gene_type:complete